MERIVEIENLSDNSSEKVYLLEVFNENSGLFFHNGKVLFAEKVIGSGKASKIETVSLTLVTNLFISPVKDNSIYASGYYNVIYFNGDKTSEVFESFKKLCFVYSEDISSTFEDFFYSLITIFQLLKATTFTDTIGLFGELCLIKEVWEKHSIDLSKYWHIDGSNSKYDFQTGLHNIEVKSTSVETNTFHIKHSQIFNRNNNFLVLVKLNKGGKTLKELFEYFNSESPFSTNYNFQINLHSYSVNITEQQNNLKYEISNMYIYESEKLETIANIPQEINNISYEYTFDFNIALKLTDLMNLFSQV